MTKFKIDQVVYFADININEDYELIALPIFCYEIDKIEICKDATYYYFYRLGFEPVKQKEEDIYVTEREAREAIIYKTCEKIEKLKNSLLSHSGKRW